MGRPGLDPSTLGSEAIGAPHCCLVALHLGRRIANPKAGRVRICVGILLYQSDSERVPLGSKGNRGGIEGGDHRTFQVGVCRQDEGWSSVAREQRRFDLVSWITASRRFRTHLGFLSLPHSQAVRALRTPPWYQSQRKPGTDPSTTRANPGISSRA